MEEVENGRELVTRIWEMDYRPNIQEFLDTNRSDTVPVSNSEYQNTLHDVFKEVEYHRRLWKARRQRRAPDIHQPKCTVHLVHQPCILTQATSNLHPGRPGHPQSKCGSWLHPVSGNHTLNLPKHPDRSHNTRPHPDTTP